MEIKEFIDKGPKTVEGKQFVVKYNKTLGTKSPGRGYYLTTCEVAGPLNYCCDWMAEEFKTERTWGNTLGLQNILEKDTDRPTLGILLITEEMANERGCSDSDVSPEHVPISHCPGCGAVIILELNELFQLKCREKITKTCETYTEKVNVE